MLLVWFNLNLWNLSSILILDNKIDLKYQKCMGMIYVLHMALLYQLHIHRISGLDTCIVLGWCIHKMNIRLYNLVLFI